MVKLKERLDTSNALNICKILRVNINIKTNQTTIKLCVKSLKML